MRGTDLIALGVPQGPHVGKLLEIIAAQELTPPEVAALVQRYVEEEITKPLLLEESQRVYPENPTDKPVQVCLDKELYPHNYTAVMAAMNVALATPHTRSGRVLPDSCPAGVLPVGGVVSSEKLHPGFHSADICCSMYLSHSCEEAEDQTAADVFEEYKRTTHFGAGGRKDIDMPDYLVRKIEGNALTAELVGIANEDFGTQGDGNHFGFVGHSENNGSVNLVTHHGSRRFGARLYKKAMEYAEKHCSERTKGVPKQAFWLPDELTDEYWSALEVVREWVLANHRAIHMMAGMAGGTTLFTPHNFVFKRGGLFYHAKGATPIEKDELSVIPLNASSPVLLVNGQKKGWAPHGAGRHMSRTAFLRGKNAISENYHLEFFTGNPDESEYPEAYKPTSMITQNLEDCEVYDRIMPFKSLMAGRFIWKDKKG